jgi:subtilisin family serine protease
MWFASGVRMSLPRLLALRLPLALAATLYTAACADSGDGGSLDDSEAAADPTVVPGRYFVGFRTTPGKSQVSMLQSRGGRVIADFGDIRVLHVAMNPSAATALTADASIEYVEPEPLHHPLSLSDAQLVPSADNGLFGLVTTHSLDAQALGATGAGINVGIADTGLDYTHPDIAPNFRGGTDALTGDGDPFWDNDPAEVHGTHVAGTILAADNGLGVIGVAPQANLFHARVCDANGCPVSAILEGVRFLVEEAGCKVVNLSLGGARGSRTEQRFYESMRAQGALVVAAAGNETARKISFPAAFTVNVAVGAVDRDNVHADFSNTGRQIDVSAPGVNVLSSVGIGAGSEASVDAGGSQSAFGMEFAGKTGSAGLSGTLVSCGLGQPGECPAEVRGNIALIQRGTISFAEKVTTAMDAGAAAAIIFNNVAGDFTGTLGTETTADGRAWIPGVTVSDTIGAALLAQVGSSATVLNALSDWDTFSGTSMATPHTTGAIALIWSVDPTRTNDQVEADLFATTTDLGAAGFDNVFGRGLINAAAAVQRAQGQ